MTLRSGDREYYCRAPDRQFPGLSDEYRRRYGDAYEVNSPDNGRLMRIFHDVCEKHGVLHDPEDCFRYIEEIPERQTRLPLFE